MPQATLRDVQVEQPYVKSPLSPEHSPVQQLPIQGEAPADGEAVKAESLLCADAEQATVAAAEKLPVGRTEQEGGEVIRPAESSPQVAEKMALSVRDLQQPPAAQLDRMHVVRESVMEQVFEKMVFSSDNSGDAKLFIRLKPATLGEVTITLRMEDGQLTGRIVAESALVGEMLDASLGQIKQRLEAQQIHLFELTVSVGQEKGFQRGRDWSEGAGTSPGGQEKHVLGYQEEISRSPMNILPGLLNTFA